mgnify:CR=1 FL=1
MTSDLVISGLEELEEWKTLKEQAYLVDVHEFMDALKEAFPEDGDLMKSLHLQRSACHFQFSSSFPITSLFQMICFILTDVGKYLAGLSQSAAVWRYADKILLWEKANYGKRSVAVPRLRQVYTI